MENPAVDAVPSEATSTAGAAATPEVDGSPADAGYVEDDDEEGMIVHAGFGAPQKPVAASAVGGPVFLGLDGEEATGEAEETDVVDVDTEAKPAQS